MEASSTLCWAGLYDGTGRHVSGLFPPMAVNNVLTEACTTAATSRPFWRTINLRPNEHGGDNLGLVWMVPLGLLPVPEQFPTEIIGALVQAIDHGYAIIIGADRADTVATVAGMVVAFTVGPFGAGGGRA